MKKLLFLGLIIIGIIFAPSMFTNPRDLLFRPGANSFSKENRSKITESQKWEYLKVRLMPKGGKAKNVPKFQGPILVSLENATEEQRVLVGEVVQEIQELLPNKRMSLFKDHTGFTPQEIIDSVSNSSVLNDFFDLYSESISITFGDKPSPNTDYIRASKILYPRINTSVLSDSTVIKRSGTPLQPVSEITGTILCFNFSKESDSLKQKKYIKYEILRSLCNIQIDDRIDNDISNPIKRLNRFQYLLNFGKGVYGNSGYYPENYEITEYDTFLLEKLYSNTFESQLKEYLTQNYPALYVHNFYHVHWVKIFSEILALLLGVIIFMISLSALHKRKFRFGLFNYLIPILLVNLSILGLLNMIKFLQLDYLMSFYYRNFMTGFFTSVLFVSLLQSIFLWAIEHFVVKKLDNFVFRLGLKVMITFLSYVIPYYLISWFSYGYGEHILMISLIIAISRGLYIYLNHYSESITRKKDLEISQLKELQLATELNSLHAQINPHFLYNALNSIASLSKTDGTKTEKMALSLSDLFRYSVNRKGEKMATIQEEVEMVHNYLQIEKIRFEDRLEFNIEVDDSLEKIEIPRFILQPLIENAIKHGISKIEDRGLIELQIERKQDNLMIAVSDNGPNFPEGLVSGHGLQSVFDLLRLSYGEQASINWENLPKKKITIIIKSNTET